MSSCSNICVKLFNIFKPLLLTLCIISKDVDDMYENMYPNLSDSKTEGTEKRLLQAKTTTWIKQICVYINPRDCILQIRKLIS